MHRHGLVLGLVWAMCLLAAQAAEQPHPLSNLPPAGDITVVHQFPDHPLKQFAAGDVIKVVVGIHNDASVPYNISAIMGSLNSPDNFQVYIQNFTQQVYFEPLPPGEELSVEYAFMVDQLVIQRDFFVALTLFYQEPNGGYLSTTFFNQTVDIVEKPKLIDTEILFLYLILAALAAAAGWLAYSQVSDKLGIKMKPKKTRKGKITEVKATNDDEWLSGTPYMQQKKKQAAKLSKAAAAAAAAAASVDTAKEL